MRANPAVPDTDDSDGCVFSSYCSIKLLYSKSALVQSGLRTELFDSDGVNIVPFSPIYLSVRKTPGKTAKTSGLGGIFCRVKHACLSIRGDSTLCETAEWITIK